MSIPASILLANHPTLTSRLLQRSLSSWSLSLDDELVQLIKLADDGLPLHHSQIPQAFLNQLLYLAFFGLILMLTKCILRPPASVLSEVVVGELRRLTEKGAEQGACLKSRISMQRRHGHDDKTVDRIESKERKQEASYGKNKSTASR